MNRHSNNSNCSMRFATTVQDRKESAAKLLKAVELSEARSKRSFRSLNVKSIDLSARKQPASKNAMMASFD